VRALLESVEPSSPRPFGGAEVNITVDELNAEVERALATWPFIPTVERDHHLPVGLLLAVGSRETNLTNEVGDGGHGHGVWQLDNRSHVIPDGFDADVKAQATTAATMLEGLIAEFGDLAPALAAYNAGAGDVSDRIALGRSVDAGTAGGDYSADVLDRLRALGTKVPTTVPPAVTTQPEIVQTEDDDMAVVAQATDTDQAMYLFWSGRCVKMVPEELANIAAILGISAAPTVHKSTAQIELAAACLNRPNGKR
jgi:hypothetical protein